MDKTEGIPPPLPKSGGLETTTPEDQPGLPRITVNIIAGPDTGKSWRLHQSCISIGRADDNDLVLKSDDMISRSHLHLTYENGSWIASDADSSNGTYLQVASEMMRLTNALDLHRGACIHIGQTSLALRW